MNFPASYGFTFCDRGVEEPYTVKLPDGSTALSWRVDVEGIRAIIASHANLVSPSFPQIHANSSRAELVSWLVCSQPNGEHSDAESVTAYDVESAWETIVSILYGV